MPPAPAHVGHENSSVGELLLLVFPYSGQSDVLVLSDCVTKWRCLRKVVIDFIVGIDCSWQCPKWVNCRL